MGNNGDRAKGFEFKKFATPRIIAGVAIAIIVLWALVVIFSSPVPTAPPDSAGTSHDTPLKTTSSAETSHVSSPQADDHAATDTTHAGTETEADGATASSHQAAAGHVTASAVPSTDSHGSTSTAKAADTHATVSKDMVTHSQPATTAHKTTSQTAAKPSPVSHSALPATAIMAPIHKPKPKGVAFVEAAIKPLYQELEERWWGWRPNDIINVTDNINNFQMGVLEVTRRTTVALAERISRTGTTDAFDENLEQAMNWFMVKATSYWFPSAESKYKEGLEELETYLQKLEKGKATFYIRTDNLIPLLSSFEDLLGSCDENLVKQANEDGSPVSFFAVDDYFFYTQGVASSMATVLEAVHHDFLLTLESRNATELLHHAILSCQRAAAIQPWIILDRDLSSILANHRANMAAPISHARFYLGQLIKTLST
ncbi:DUF2333 family protein [Desulfosarcina ovata]|uniref:DUF2333 domain-containing protein n=1 Tax=Desulfosarcina ovata subsp. ovata TaxID=2752305 RepID=A0A5K8A6F4_9BACT|nr:DUF2333 family protein [Desulfosarcina ovata]BBO88213.1 hypothetical protein DSCOOX_13930 [Desulfosarcina ovata subsp. ovata]